MNYPKGLLSLPLQELYKTFDLPRSEAVYRPPPSIYSYTSEKEAQAIDHLSAIYRDIRPLSLIGPRKGLL